MAPQSPSPPPSAPSDPPPTLEQSERYKRLKRRFEEIEQESVPDAQTNERNVRLREERDVILQQLQELERNISLPRADSPSHPNDNSHSFELSTTKPRASVGHALRLLLDEDVESQAIASGSRSAQFSSPSHEEMSSSETFRESRRNGRRSGSRATPSPNRLPSRRALDEDVHMSDGTRSTPSTESFQPPSSVDATSDDPTLTRSLANGRQTTQGNRAGQDLRETGSPPSSKQQKGARGTDSAALIRAASAAARAEASEGDITPMDTTSVINGSPKSPSVRPPPAKPASGPSEDVEMDQAKTKEHPSTSPNNTSSISGESGAGPSSSTPASMNLLAQAAQEATTAASSGSHTSPSKTTEGILSSASFESIVRVAEAAVAAQVAAQTASSSTSSPNVDPSLTSQSEATPPPPTPTTTSSPPPKQSAPNGTKSDAAPSASSPSHLSGNPYASLALQKPGIPIPSPFMIPYPYFFPPPPNSPHPPTPVTPTTPTYPIYNPYYYLPPPVLPGPNGMYPPPPPAFMPPSLSPPRSADPPRPKSKRLKAHAVVSKSCSIPVVPRDKKGKPMLPLNVGIMTVISLGDVCMREHFHTERYIFPVGYEVTRRYLSTVDPSIEVVYHCTILDGGDGPKFQIIPSDRPDKPVIAGTATGAWSNIVKQANAIRNRQHSNSVSGPDFFGLGQNTIKHLIQELPNANKLRDYVWQNFVEGGPLGGRHAAVIPALPEEYDASLPLGAYYPKRDLSNPNLPRGMAHYPQHIIAQAEAERASKTGPPENEAGSSRAPVPGPSGIPSHPPHQHGHHPHQHPPGHPLQPPLPQHHIQPDLEIADMVDPAAAVLAAAAHLRAAAASVTAGTSVTPPIASTSTSGSQSQEGADGLGDGLGHGATTFAGLMNAYPNPGGGLVPVPQQQQQAQTTAPPAPLAGSSITSSGS